MINFVYQDSKANNAAGLVQMLKGTHVVHWYIKLIDDRLTGHTIQL